eukprot:15325714-Ditylum_brightwellii.AAC.1
MTDEERRLAWYSKDELKAFRNNAKEVIRLKRKRHLKNSDIYKPQHISEYEHDSCDRGLESYINPEHAENKAIAMDLFMKCQRRLHLSPTSTIGVANPASCLAAISRRLSKWAGDVALATAHRDYIAAYPEIEPLFPAVMDPVFVSDFPWRKRKLNCFTHERPEKGRRVKIRMSAPTGYHINNTIN